MINKGNIKKVPNTLKILFFKQKKKKIKNIKFPNTMKFQINGFCKLNLSLSLSLL